LNFENGSGCAYSAGERKQKKFSALSERTGLNFFCSS